MKTRRYVLGLLGASLPAWAAESPAAIRLFCLVRCNPGMHEVRTENTGIAMSDGTRLAARVPAGFRPARRRRP